MVRTACSRNMCTVHHLFYGTVLVYLAQLTLAQREFSGCVKQMFHIYQQNQVDRRFIISENAPTAEVLRTRPDLNDRIEPMTNLLKSITKAVDFRRRTNDEKQCNLQDVNRGWVYTAHLASEFLQIGKLNSTCYSQIDGSDAVSSGLLSRDEFENSMKVIGDGVQALYEAVSNIKESPEAQGLGNWTNSFPLRNWRVGDDMQRCKVETFSAYRMGDNFFLRAPMTNHRVEKFVTDRSRQFVSEWVRDDYSQSLRVVHPSLKHRELVAGTTVLEEWHGRAWISWHGQMLDNDNPAVRRSSEQNEIDIDLAADSMAPANIAIISLPLLMSFIPYAFVADLNTLGSLMYVLFTDVISVVPFLIKGIELVQSTRSHPALVAYYAGDIDLADIQIWAADCTGRGRLRTIGWVFIAVGVFTMLFGIALEIIGEQYMVKKRKEDGAFVAGPFGKAIIESTGKGLLGARSGLESDAFPESDYSSDSDPTVSDVENEKPGVELESTQVWRKQIISWVRILIQYTSLEALQRPLTAGDMEAGVGHDGLASAERDIVNSSAR